MKFNATDNLIIDTAHTITCSLILQCIALGAEY